MFANNLRLFYLYLVSFVALLTTVFAVYGSAAALMDIIVFGSDSGTRAPGVTLSYYFRNLFNMCAFWIVALPVYLFHWKAIEKEEGRRGKIADQTEVREKWES